MNSNLTDKEKKKRQHKKELISLRNKMGKNIVWFDALTKTQQYDLLFAWKREKFNNNIKQPKKLSFKRRVGGYANGSYQIITKKIEIINYPPKLKHFIKDSKPLFNISLMKMRESRLKHLLD